ncbi:MAG: TIGR04076 family protein [Thermotogota bacterium]
MAAGRSTIVKRILHKELSARYIHAELFPRGFGLCSLFAEGQTFTARDFLTKPDDFPCDWAWTDIQCTAAVIDSDADFPWFKENGKVVACRSDGMRPVSFLIERIEA